MARPTIYFDKFTPETETEILANYALGKSDVVASLTLGVHRDTFYTWLKDEDKKAFSDTIKKGRESALMFWEDKLQEGMYTKDINATLMIFCMKNRFKADYGEQKSDVQVTNNYYDVNVPKRPSEKEWLKGIEE